MIVLIGSIVAAQNNDPPILPDVLERLEEQHGTLKTLAVQFEQIKHFSFMDKPIISRGFIVFEVPDKIRFDITEPFQSSLLDDGRKIQQYEFVDDQWHSIQFGGGKSIKLVMEQIGQWMQGKFAGQEELFSLSVRVGDPNDFAILGLEPCHKQFRRYIEKIHIYIKKPPAYTVHRIDIFEPEGDSFSLQFVNEKRNKPLPKSCFQDPATATQCMRLFESKGARQK